MSTEVEQQPTVAPVIIDKPLIEENGTATVAEITTITPNGESKTEEKKNGAVKKEPEPPKDPKTETQEWLEQQRQQRKAIPHKANYYLLNWGVNEVYAEDDKSKPALSKSGFVTRREFVNQLKDGVILAHLANKFQPGAAEPVKEGEEAKIKENQQANVNVFTSVAKQFVPENELFSYEDLEKGKESYPKIFSTLFQTMLHANTDQFKVPGGNFEQFTSEINAVSNQKFFQKFLNNLNSLGDNFLAFMRRPFARSNSNAQPETEQNGAATTNGVHVNSIETVHEENGVSNGVKVEEKKEETLTTVIATN